MAPAPKLAPWRVGLPAMAGLPGTTYGYGGVMLKRFVPSRIDTDPGHHIRMGVVAAVIIMIASWGVGWLPQAQNSWFAGTTILNPLRVWTPGVTVCAVFLVVGGLLLVRSWIRLGQALQLPFTTGSGGPSVSSVKESARKHRINDSKLSVINRAIWWWAAPLTLAFPIMSRDVFSYLAQGRVLHAGLDPYGEGVSSLPGWFMIGADSLWAQSPSPYGPAFLLVSQFVWFITDGGPEWSILLFRLMFLGGMAMCMWAIPRLARRFGARGDWAQWIVIANPLFCLYMIAGAHNDTLMLGLLLTGLYFINPSWPQHARRRRILLGFVLLAGSIAIKPLTVLVLPFAGLLLLWKPGVRMSYRVRIKVWTKSVVVVGGVLLVFGAITGLWFGWIEAMTTSGSAAFPYAPFGLLGLGIGWLVDVLFSSGIDPVAQTVYALGTVAIAVVTAWLALKPRPMRPVLSAALALATAVLVAQVFQPWYILWVLPLFAIVGVWRGWASTLLYLLVTVLVVVGVVDQLAVSQWIPILPLRLLTAGIGLIGLIVLMFFDPLTRRAFPQTKKTVDA
ncbi:polyprenol phosphomannose-dependent alpha 1,6 mannosyltransferase MptB [Yaniella flava]